MSSCLATCLADPPQPWERVPATPEQVARAEQLVLAFVKQHCEVGDDRWVSGPVLIHALDAYLQLHLTPAEQDDFAFKRELWWALGVIGNKGNVRWVAHGTDHETYVPSRAAVGPQGPAGLRPVLRPRTECPTVVSGLTLLTWPA